jgi:hypothetical protein
VCSNGDIREQLASSAVGLASLSGRLRSCVVEWKASKVAEMMDLQHGESSPTSIVDLPWREDYSMFFPEIAARASNGLWNESASFVLETLPLMLILDPNHLLGSPEKAAVARAHRTTLMNMAAGIPVVPMKSFMNSFLQRVGDGVFKALSNKGREVLDGRPCRRSFVLEEHEWCADTLFASLALAAGFNRDGDRLWTDSPQVLAFFIAERGANSK